MRIIFIGQKGIPAQTGGVERYVENLSQCLVKEGHEVIVYAHKEYGKTKEYKGVKIITLPSLPGKNFEAISHTFLACFDLLFRKVDIINFQSIGPSSLIWLAKILKPRTPIVFTFHCQDYYHQKWGRFARWYLKFGEKVGCTLADKVITVSKGIKDYVKKTYNVDAVYIPNGIFIPHQLEANNIKQWGLEKDNYIVAISRLIRHKGLHYLISAYQKLKTDKKLVIVGSGSYTSDYVQELHDLAKDNDNIIFTGNQSGDTLTELFSNAVIFVQPSENEGLSIALLEGMSHKKACIVSDIDANTEAINNTGLVFKNKDIDDLKDKLQYLLDHSEKIEEMGNKAVERAKKEYAWSNIVKNIVIEYNKLTNKNN